MLFFGHIGITTGIVKVCQELITSNRFGGESRLKSYSGTAQSRKQTLLDVIRDKTKSIDYRFILLGSILPDIIDKPVWMFTDSNFQWSGRGYAHTFLFSFMLLLIGLILATRWNKTWLLTISAGSFFHLIFDQMWQNPTTLWWPLLGPIQRGATAGWLSGLWQGLTSDPYIYVSETIGFIVILYLTLRLLVSRRVIHFLKTGDIDFSESSAGGKKIVRKARKKIPDKF